MNIEPNLNSFSLKEKIDDMMLNEQITMRDVYKAYTNYINGRIGNTSIEIKFFNCSNDFFSFEIGNIKGYDFLNEPIEIIINNKKIDIICEEQVNFLKREYIIESIKCLDDNSKDFLSLSNLLQHKNHSYILQSINIFKLFQNQQEIDNYLLNFFESFINRTFETPKHFEKNYDYYFNMKNNMMNNLEFTIFEDITTNDRYRLVKNIINFEFGHFYYFFGSSGKGKSITLIGALKYGKKSELIGTLYVNCKTLRVLYRQHKIEIMKQIIIDEIVFLLRNKYNEYKECCEKVKKFSFKDEYDFWFLIEDILDFVNNIENYYFIIGFDQYNNENDINLRLNRIEAKYKDSKKFRIVVFSSMNESDVRDIKIQYLFDYNPFIQSLEIKNICSDFHTGFNTEEQEVFNILGKSIKAYNEILQIKMNKSQLFSLNNYLEEKRKKIKFKFFCFYKDAKERKDLFYGDNTIVDFSKCMGQILSFIPNEEYSKEELRRIIIYIPFRFFNIIKKGMKYIITYAYPLIEEILIEIYKDLILNNSFKIIKEITKGSGAFGCIFEFAVISYIIKKSNSDNKNLFNYFNISKNLSIKKFVLNSNEKLANIKCEKLELDSKYDYIIEQQIFNGKTLDFILIHFINSTPYVYGFQVSIYKSKIYSLEELEKSYKIMIQVLKKYFDIDFIKENMFFGYIFNYEDVHTDKYAVMLNKCEIGRLKYCFFDPYNQKFVDKKGEDIKDINNIVSTVFSFKKIKPTNYMEDFVFYPLTINYGNIGLKLNHFQYQAVTSIVKERRGQETTWKILKCTNYDELISEYGTHLHSKRCFYLCYNEPHFKAVFFNPYKAYNLLYDGNIEETNVDNRVEIYICEIIRDTQIK